ncbi:carbonic anhydrase [Planomicrobium chinense]|uniref:carbonic anhydrase n=3 Tax=Planococcus TaxID=1372 RepID=A0A7H8QD24_9BACL|nr:MULTISPECIES: carbonic anhydrase [Planococcus]MCP2036631.1 carbonic anhydrase [Planomicrobium sp. HSC-17F08]KOF09657.1 carbonic anhydrase [Planococcus glaciei]MBX0316705.1 carbonic anhydrase [Planococcus glaciei]MBZ5202773.1 carbonic anhydrase [Planococcus chinensis]MDN7229205.1 carbonic anhydrase [Planococcus sp. N064]
MSMLEDILEYNEQFVENKEYEQYITTKFPDKKIVILTCMDTRLFEMLPKAMNLKNGDVKIVKSAGAVINHPFGGIMRSLFVAVYELKAEEIYIIGHHDCGMSAIDPTSVLEKMKARGIDEKTIEQLKYSGVNIEDWLRGFDDVNESVRHSVNMVKNHPLMDRTVPVHGLVIDPTTGKLDIVINGNENR